MYVKKIGLIILSLFSLQLFRVAFKNVIFYFVNRTLLADVLVNVIYMSLIIVIMCIIIIKKKIDICVFPNSNLKIYIFFTILLALFVISTPIITHSYSLYNICFMLYGGIITVIYEELIFRGFVWYELKNAKGDLFAYILSTILFGLWHLGYIDTVLWRTSLFNPTADIFNITLWKAITGAVLGIAFGFLRYKGKNIYASMLLHSFINTFGS